MIAQPSHSQIGIIWLIGLVSLQSIPHTGAIRTFFLLAGIAHLSILARYTPRPNWPIAGVEKYWLGLLSSWLIIQSALFAAVPAESLIALSGEWLKLLLMVALGILVATYADHKKECASWPVLGIFFGYFLHVVSTLSFQAWSYMRSGGPTLGDSFLGNYGYTSPFVTGALAFLLAEGVIRLRQQQHWLPFSNATLLLLLVASLVAQAVLIAKASIVVAIILFLVAALATGIPPNSRRWLILFLVGGILVFSSSLMISNRWQGAIEAVTTAFSGPVDFQTLEGTQDPTAPVNKLEPSFYLRASWAKIGLEGVAQHPLGLGYGSDAFGRYVAERKGTIGAVSSHSGWIDFALANGILGLFLLLALFWAVGHRGWISYRAGNPVGLACLLVTLGFVVRSALDGHLYGSRFTGFAFVAATLWAMAAQPRTHADSHSG